MTSQAKMTMPNSQRYTCNLYLVNNMEDNVVILGVKVFILIILYLFPCSRNAQVTKEITIENISFKIIEHF